jgi:outer membrane receptor for ferrienterochelin and colicins
MKNIVICILLLLSMAGALLAQDGAELTVTVSEKNGVVPNAVVVLTNANGETIRQISSSQGLAIFRNMQAGEYSLKATFIGFAPHAEEITLAAGANNVDVRLILAHFSETITVTTANRRVELLKNVAEPTTVLTQADIQDAGALSAKDMLQEMGGAGVTVATGGGMGHVSINGVGNQGVLILIDGKRMLGKNLFGEVNLEDMDMSRFERVEVVKGAGSALYGSDAYGGVINFISKKPESAAIHNAMNINYGSYNDLNVADTLSFSQEKISASISTSMRKNDGYDLWEEDPRTQGQPQSSYATLGGKLEFAATDNIMVRGMFDYNKRGVENYYFNEVDGEYPDTHIDKTNVTLAPELDWLVGENTMLSLGYTFGDYQRDEKRVFADDSEDVLEPWKERNHVTNATLNQGWSMGGIDNTLLAGYEFRKESMDRDIMADPESGDTLIERNVNVIWGQNEFNFTDNFKITAGFRYDSYSDFGDAFSPKVSGIFAINDQNRLRATYGKGFRAPRFDELNYEQIMNFGFFLFKMLGNPDLEPETANNFTFGYTHTGSMINGSFDVFYNKMENGIVMKSLGFVGGALVYSFENVDELTAKGFNTEWAVNLPYGFVPSFAYSFVGREDAEGEELLDTGRQSFYVKMLWSNPRLGARANFRWQHFDSVDMPNDIVRPAYSVIDFNARKNLFATNGFSVALNASIDNLLDNTFLEDTTGVMLDNSQQIWLPPRTFKLGFVIDFDKFGQ